MSRPLNAASLAALNERKPLWPVASLCVLTGLNLLDYVDRFLLSSVLTPIKEELHLSDEQLGTIQSAFMWGYFLTSPLFGYLGDKMPRRWLVGAGVFVWSFGTLMTGHMSNLGSLIFFRVLVGFGEASFGTISPGWIADLFPPARRNNAISIFYLAIPVGAALGVVFGGWVAARYGWRSAFLWAGYPGLLLAFALLFLREPVRGAMEEKEVEEHAGGWSRYLHLFRYPRYLLVVAGYVAQVFGMGAFAFWGPTFLARVHHMDFANADYFFGHALAITGITATLLGGFAATAWQRKTGTGYAWILALSSLLTAPAAYVAFSIADLTLAKVALVAAMFLILLCTGPINTLILETVPVTMRAKAVAGSIFAIHLFGDLWSPRLVGYYSDRWHDLQRACLMFLPIALLISAVFWGWLVVSTKRASEVARSS